jgi:hypothetical protein
MPDEFYQRYEHFTHPQLYSMVMAGLPDQVDGLLAVWTSIETTMSGLAATLRADLGRLLASWDSPAGREFDRRVGMVADYAQALADEYGAIHTGLTAMSSALADARSCAEAPDLASENASESRAHGMAAGALLGPLGTLIGGVIGGSLGRERDEAEQENARQRMIRLVCALATDYRVTDFGTWPQQVPLPPADLPGYRPGTAMGEAPPAVQQRNVAPPAEAVTPIQSTPQQTGPVNQPVAQPPKDVTPGVVTAAGPDPTATADQQEWWGTAPAVAGGIGVAVAGGIAAATAAANRGRTGHTATEATEAGPQLDSDGVVRVGGSETAIEPITVAEADPTPVEMMTSDAPKGSHLPSVDLGFDPPAEGQQPTPTISALPTLEAVSAQDVVAPDGPSELAGGATGDGGPVEADSRGSGGPTPTNPPPPPASATGLGGTPGVISASGGGPAVGGAGATPGVTGGTTGTPTSLAAATGPAVASGSGHTGGTTAGGMGAGGSGFDGNRGIDDRRWQTDGRMNWGDDGVDPTTITRPEASDIDFGDTDETP